MADTKTAATSETSRYLSELQSRLETFYRLEPAPSVNDFILPESLAKRYNPTGELREALLIAEDDGLNVGLLLDVGASAVLHDDKLDIANLNAFSVVVEGVSHFLCVMHRARRDQPTSQLELELQGEVDKFISALVFARRCPSLAPKKIQRHLFQRFQLAKGLSVEQRRRYVRANLMAQRYASCLERRFVRRRRLPAMMSELRQFYRADLRGKQDIMGRTQ